jgi:hypothetical protein
MSRADDPTGEGDRPALGPIATRILYEDDQVRIWDQRIPPGTATGPHHRALPYALVNVAGARLEVGPVAGYPAMHGDERLSVELQDRTAMILEAGAYEDAFNPDERAYRAILVEFKQGD